MEEIFTTEFPFSEVNLTDITDTAELKLAYTALEVLVAIFAVIGNAMVIIVFRRERRLRRRTNYYIISLAVADLLVGLFGIPFAILADIGLPTNLHACLFTLSILIVLCTISIFCLVAVSVDRYWAILYPMGYSRNVRTKTAIVIISVCWVAGSIVGFLPLFGWHSSQHTNTVQCYFTRVMEHDFLVFLYFTTIVTPSIVLAAFYAHIYRVVVKQLRQIVTMNPGGGSGINRTKGTRRSDCSGSGTMLRVLGAAQKREVKATQNLAIIVLFFIICWMPLYTINCIEAFCSDCHIEKFWVNFCIILSHLNSAVNPLLYAYHLKDFRAALKSFICNIFGIKETNPANDNYYKPSLVSLGHRKPSYTEKRIAGVGCNHSKIFIDSPVWLKQKVVETSGEIIQRDPRDESNDTGDRKYSIWKITEVPSAAESREEKSPRKTSGYLDEDVDDEVFLPAYSDFQKSNVRVNGIADHSTKDIFSINIVQVDKHKVNEKTKEICHLQRSHSDSGPVKNLDLNVANLTESILSVQKDRRSNREDRSENYYGQFEMRKNVDSYTNLSS